MGSVAVWLTAVAVATYIKGIGMTPASMSPAAIATPKSTTIRTALILST
jgi:hypothetical protein